MGSVYRLGWLSSSTQQVYATQSSSPHTSTLHSPDGNQVINAPRQTDRWTNRQTDGQTNRQTDRQMERQTPSQTEWTDLLSKSLDGSDKDASGVWSCREHAQNGELSTDGLATASGGTNKHIIICVVEGVEHCRERGKK